MNISNSLQVSVQVFQQLNDNENFLAVAITEKRRPGDILWETGS